MNAWKRRLPFLLSISLAIVVVDQVTKYLAVKHLTLSFDGEARSPLQRFWSVKHPVPSGPSTVVDGFFDFQYVENPGAAWGLPSGANEAFRGPFFLLVSVIAAALILNWYFRSDESFRLRRWALALVFGGAIGNFLDRVRLQYVIDFVDWHWKNRYHWPTFNVADAAISIGVVLLLLESFLQKEPVKEGSGKTRSPATT